MRRLIVNADDFGMSAGVNAGILRAHRHGIVTSTTVLVTGRVDGEAVAAARDSGLGIGLHVNLTLGRPLTAGPSLGDAQGRFVRDPWRVAARARVGDVEREVEAQVARFLDLFGRRPTHLDSHHHVGVHAPVDGVVLAVARRLGVAVRSQDERVRARARAGGLRTPDHFEGESGPGPYWTPARTLRHLRRLRPGVTEFMSHPALFDAGLAGSRYGRQRETELVALGGPSARATVAALGIRLAHFGDL